MALEIERKYLIDLEKISPLENGIRIKQGYLSTEPIFKFIEFDLEHFQEMNLPMAIDGFHPSKEIYEIWGKQVASLVREFFTS